MDRSVGRRRGHECADQQGLTPRGVPREVTKPNDILLLTTLIFCPLSANRCKRNHDSTIRSAGQARGENHWRSALVPTNEIRTVGCILSVAVHPLTPNSVTNSIAAAPFRILDLPQRIVCWIMETVIVGRPLDVLVKGVQRVIIRPRRESYLYSK